MLSLLPCQCLATWSGPFKYYSSLTTLQVWTSYMQYFLTVKGLHVVRQEVGILGIRNWNRRRDGCWLLGWITLISQRSLLHLTSIREGPSSFCVSCLPWTSKPTVFGRPSLKENTKWNDFIYSMVAWLQLNTVLFCIFKFSGNWNQI